MQHLNLGVLAHVDAGKTSLTERLLFEAGVIRRAGSVDAGTTQTDSLPLEQRRGITIKSSVVAFPIGTLTVNVIDTPGHPDFIAEVERALAILDAAVLVISGIDGVQPQSQLLMRVLSRLGVPTLLFINKLDRPNADFDRSVASVVERLTPAAIVMGELEHAGTPDVAFHGLDLDGPRLRSGAASILAERDERLLEVYVADVDPPTGLLAEILARETAAANVHPTYGGSARTGAGVRTLMHGIETLLRPSGGAGGGAPEADVFKVERLRSGERVAVARVRSGTLRTRDHLQVGTRETDAITAIDVAEVGGWKRRGAVAAGQIARLHGLSARIGDVVGTSERVRKVTHLASPMLEAVIRPKDRGDAGALSAALLQLAEQDPLIQVHHDAFGELVVALFGDVQREVLATTIEEDYALEVDFDQSRPVCVERPTSVGSAIERLEDLENPYSATVGLKIEPAEPAAGIEVLVAAPSQRLPLHIYKNREKFRSVLTEIITTALRTGPYGWRVTDCVVTMTDCDYLVADGPRPPGKGDTTALDFRRLTPVVLGQAVRDAGTTVCEPIACLNLELPTRSLSATLTLLARFGGSVDTPEIVGTTATLRGYVRVARLQEVRRQLVDATGGYGVVEVTLAGYEPVRGDPPTSGVAPTTRPIGHR